ncbi:MAG: SpoIIE family protein phosphatase [Campylobacterales bacterium]|nr:SpoIIE family protein phosphatase [Campylobacterales bacterium]
MRYVDEITYTSLRLAVPPSILHYGEALGKILGEEAIFLAQDEAMFCDALESGLANAWVGDFAFLEQFRCERCVELALYPMLLIRTTCTPLTSTSLNHWIPSAFVDVPMEEADVKQAFENVEKALHVKEDLALLHSLQHTIKKGQTRQVVLDMERAFEKELSIIRNDLYYQQVALPFYENLVLRLDMVYKPMDLLSGDSYSVRTIDEDIVACFLIDAMSKGVAAALTSTSSTSMLNYLIDELREAETFSLETLVEKYVRYIKKELMEDEIISGFFIVFNKKELTLEYASFGMPPFLATTPRGECESIKGNNMPISPYTQTFAIDSVSLRGINRFLAYSDGLNESETTEGKAYKKELAEDFLHSVNIADFMERVSEKIGSGSDDIAYFYLQGANLSKGEKESYTLRSTRESIEEGLEKVRPFLERHGATSKVITQSKLALLELLTNALEHGSFGIDKEQKHRYLATDAFEGMLEALEKAHGYRSIVLSLRVYRQGEWKIFEATVEDEGEGFATRAIKNAMISPAKYSGRGLMIVKKLVDRFYFNAKGNAITILKRLL